VKTNSNNGFTLIEGMIAILIISILTVSVITSYNTAQDRIKYHDAVASIQTIINSMRSLALTEISGSEALANYVVSFNKTNQIIRSYLDGDVNDLGFDAEIDHEYNSISLNLGVNDLIDLKGISLLQSGEWIPMTDQNLTDLSIIYYPPYATCDIKINGSLDTASTMVQLPIYVSGSDTPTRYLYFHKKSCVPEILIQDIKSL
jgi:prepilin-type N-terminal cleavage/methylation domain-containing protein